tara:strand:+ start:590 stop:1975 length:1386 start_codon:yes stop_codon:yes gene_type:complete
MGIITKGGVVVSMIVLSSCASIVSTSKYPISIDSSPSKSEISITNKKGKEVYSGSTPAIVELKSGSGFFQKATYQVEFTKEGFDTVIAPLNSKLDSWYFGNIIVGFIGMLAVDPITGAMYKLENDSLFETLPRLATNINIKEKTVDRNNEESIDLVEFEQEKQNGNYLKKLESNIELAVKQEDYKKAQILKENKELYFLIVLEDSLIRISVDKSEFKKAEEHKVKRDIYTKDLLGLSTRNSKISSQDEVTDRSKQIIPKTEESVRNRIFVNTALSYGAIYFNTSKEQPIEVKYTPQVAAKVGLDYKFPAINNVFHLEAGGTFSILKFKLKESDYNSRMDLTALYFGTHLYGNYEIPNSKLMLTFGPFLDIGILGTQEIEDGAKYNWFTGNDAQTEAPMKRLNLGLTFKASIEASFIKSIDELYLSYRLGLYNIENIEAPSGVNQSTTTWLFCLGLRKKLFK